PRAQDCCAVPGTCGAPLVGEPVAQSAGAVAEAAASVEGQSTDRGGEYSLVSVRRELESAPGNQRTLRSRATVAGMISRARSSSSSVVRRESDRRRLE